jgi:metal-responsive CopG/Arc/MetJ family transcriptional regulator
VVISVRIDTKLKQRLKSAMKSWRSKSLSDAIETIIKEALES